MAYKVRYLGDGRHEIHATSGRATHIVNHPDGTWTVDEDHHRRIFPSRDDALDCARELAGDPDLPPINMV